MTERRTAVIVTGSSGLLGKSVSVAIASAGYDVFGLDCVGFTEETQSQDNVRYIECDLTDSSSVQAAMAKVREDTDGVLASVVHLAAYYDFSGEDSALYNEVNIEGTDRLLAELKNFQCMQFLFTSTMLVHVPCKIGNRIQEDDPQEAKWSYPQSKIAAERLIRENYPDVPSVILRISGVYTDYGRQPTIVNQMKRIYEKAFQGHFFPGDKDAGQSAVHIDDVVDAIVRTVERRDKIEPKTAILIGEAEPISYQTLQNLIGEQLHGKEWVTFYVPPSLAKVGAAVIDAIQGGDAFIKPFMISMADDHYALDISRAKTLLGWEPRHSLRSTLSKMTDLLKSQPDVWYRKNGLK